MRSFGKERKSKLLLCALLVKSVRAIARVRSFGKEQIAPYCSFGIERKSKSLFVALFKRGKAQKRERAKERTLGKFESPVCYTLVKFKKLKYLSRKRNPKKKYLDSIIIPLYGFI